MSKVKLVFATHNKNKLVEVQKLLGNNFQLLSLYDIDCNTEIPETHLTLEENASEKAWYVYNNFQLNCFADDTGLEIRSLNNAPGVLSARYAGEEKSSEANMKKVLEELKNKPDRKAQFRTIISLIINGKEYRFEGKVKGEIIKEKHGTDGFGYDPIFKPDGFTETFAEISMEEKNKVSHRGMAIQKLVEFLKNQQALTSNNIR